MAYAFVTLFHSDEALAKGGFTMARPRKVTRAEQEILSGAGRWQLKNGKFYDPEKRVYILRCKSCKHTFTSKRVHTKTCSELCRKRKNRAIQSAKKQPVFALSF